MADATVAEEEYLQTLFWLQEAGLPMTGANVARAMQLSAPTVHEMIGRLERDGYITRADDKAISFTADGAGHAEGIVRRHRLIERFLTDVLGVPWDEVHEEAERLEHAMSPVLEERMMAAIGDAKTCPHGHPIVEGARHRGLEPLRLPVHLVPGHAEDEGHEEAERVAQAMSPVLQERLRAALGDAKTCPHGHPIVEGARERGALLADVEEGARVHDRVPARTGLGVADRGHHPFLQHRRH